MFKYILFVFVSFSSFAFAETAFLAGGCFWGVEDLIRKQTGVTFTEVGYMGDEAQKVSYELVKTGQTKFAETVKVEFDPKKISYENLLKYYFKIHDPTTLNRQGNDIGSQYRSTIFYTDEKQKETALKLIEVLNKKLTWKKKLSTTVEPRTQWYKAEEYHQKYLVKNPGGYTCHYERKLDL